MKVLFAPDGWDDFTYWIDTDYKKVKRIKKLIEDLRKSPFIGIGQPEPLKHQLSGLWSRRIDQEHRLVYRISGSKNDQICTVMQCRFHYKK